MKTKIFRKIFLLSVFISLFSVNNYGQSQIDSLLNLAKHEIGKLNFRTAGNYLNEVEKIDSLNNTALYLRSEMRLFFGNDEFLELLDELNNRGAKEYYDVMKLKYSSFIGLSEAESLLEIYLIEYPDNGEIKFIQWLMNLDKGNYEISMQTAKEISKQTIFRFAPYLALFNVSWDKNYDNTIPYMDTVEHILGREFYGSRYRDILKVINSIDIIDSGAGKVELPFAWCGSGIGFYMIDEKGDSVKIEIDTGTGYNMMTVHDKKLGEKISGEDVLVVEDGIFYNYMEKPADLHYKKSNFSVPPINNLIFGYFESEFFKADGCTSPFVFQNRALHFDPIREKVYLFDRENMENYINENIDRIEKVPYIVRNGWIFISCKINGTEVLMQIETGSTDVNFFTLSLPALGLEPYACSIEWQGQEFPIDKVDCILEIGKIKYEVKGGLVSDNVYPNLYYGNAAAGDIGPFFMNNFAYTIDIFNQQIIFEIN